MSRSSIEKEISQIYLDLFKDKLESLKEGDTVPKEVPVGKKDFIEWVKKIIIEHYPEVSGIIDNDTVIKQFCQQIADLIAKSDTKVLNPLKDYKPSEEPTYIKANVDDKFLYNLSYFGITEKDIENAIRINDDEKIRKMLSSDEYRKLIKDERNYDFGGIEWMGEPIDKFYISPDGNKLIYIGKGYSIDPKTKKVYITSVNETNNIDLDRFYNSLRNKYTLIELKEGKDVEDENKKKKGSSMYYEKLFPKKYIIAQLEDSQKKEDQNKTINDIISQKQLIQSKDNINIQQKQDENKNKHDTTHQHTEHQHSSKRDPLKVNKFLFQILKYIPSQTLERRILEYKFSHETSLEDAIIYFENQQK